VPRSESLSCRAGVTSAASAKEYGARVPGAGISETASSGRVSASVIEATAAANGDGGAAVGVSGT
jgi:hypothetical protein